MLNAVATRDLITTKRVEPSILSADYARLGEQVATVMDAGARVIHVDVMDGHFVPPITIGPVIVEAIRDQVHAAGGMLDCHLMVERPERQIDAVRGRGRGLDHDPGRGHAERALRAAADPRRGLPRRPRDQPGHAGRGGRARCCDAVDLVLCMTVNPGWGGQAFIETSPAKLMRLRALRRARPADPGRRRHRPRHRRDDRGGGRDAVRRRLGDLRRRRPGRGLPRDRGRRRRRVALETVFDEMDLPAILRRSPRLCLIDELAHTNAPGLEHHQRYEDVEAVLAAGIDVFSTVNVQHLRSVSERIAEKTGIAIQETMPDRVVDDADEVVVVDLTPEALQARILEGKVFPADDVPAALKTFFTKDNLDVLREIALLQVVEEVEAHRLTAEMLNDEDRLISNVPAERSLMRHPFQTWPRTRRRLALVCMTALAVLPVALGTVVHPLHEDKPGGESIVDFELAGSVDRAAGDPRDVARRRGDRRRQDDPDLRLDLSR